MAGIGQVLRTARESKGITTSKAAADTNIKIQHIEEMERDDFSRMAAPIYAKGFIRIYAEYLGLDPAPLIAQYMTHYAPRTRPPLIVPEFETRGEAGGTETSAETGTHLGVDVRAWLDRAQRWLRRAVPWIGVGVVVLLVVWGGCKLTARAKARAAAREAEKAQAPVVSERKRLELPLLGEPPDPYMDALPDDPKERAP